MKQSYPANSPEARKQARRRRRIRLRIMRITAVAAVLLLVALVVALIVLRIVGTAARDRGETTSFLAVKAIEVVGDTRYTPQEIIDVSGIYVGESLLALNKVRAHNAILQRFPYLDWVNIGNSSFSTVRIEVHETVVMCAVQIGEEWMLTGENNHALERCGTEALPAGALRIVGVTPEQTEIGGALLDERSLRVVSTLRQAAQANALADMTVIDLTEKTNIRFTWRNQIQVVLGNETNLAGQVQAFGLLLPTLLKNNGDSVHGTLDMTTYADDNLSNDRAIFTPKE